MHERAKGLFSPCLAQDAPTLILLVDTTRIAQLCSPCIFVPLNQLNVCSPLTLVFVSSAFTECSPSLEMLQANCNSTSQDRVAASREHARRGKQVESALGDAELRERHVHIALVLVALRPEAGEGLAPHGVGAARKQLAHLLLRVAGA
eukprot:6193004-Pleurochrysis_carterae.AAC.15